MELHHRRISAENEYFHTELRYYEDQSCSLTTIKRLPNGRRVYTQKDVVMLNTIECLKRPA